MASEQGVLFDGRFLERHAGPIITDPVVAIVELVANAWDAWATQVDIIWPERGSKIPFSIRDNGKGMSRADFERRWSTIDYNKVAEEGIEADPPTEIKDYPKRRTYGRNGRGRHAAFRFGDPYTVRTWRDGNEVTFEVRRSVSSRPFELRVIGTRTGVAGHGTEISTPLGQGVNVTAQTVREEIGSRFLIDPSFTVSVDGTNVTFDDIPQRSLSEEDVPVPGLGIAHLYVIDLQKADKTTKQHGIAWRVNARLVGTPSWVGFDDERILDGRTTEAKRFLFIVRADFLADAVKADWSGFEATNEAWTATKASVHERIREKIANATEQRRREAKNIVKENVGAAVSRMPPASRDRWNQFVDRVVDTCPSIKTDEVEQIAVILANLELATSKYALLGQLHDLKPGDLDTLNQLLNDWTVRSAKMALDEIQTRLKLIEELDRKLRDQSLDEVADLQPLFERSLWVFGPEFESLEFTSNRGMTEVIRKLLGSAASGTRLRPDFVILPDGSVGFYSRDVHDLGHEVQGVARLVVAEIKKVGVTIGSEEKAQPWKYVKELKAKGLISDATNVTCYVLGSKVDPTEIGDDKKGDNVLIRAMPYDVFIRRAEQRMLGLRNKLRDAPFLQSMGLDANAYLEAAQPKQGSLDLAG